MALFSVWMRQKGGDFVFPVYKYIIFKKQVFLLLKPEKMWKLTFV